MAVLASDILLYLSGAASDGETQRNASASLGAFRSANYAQSLSHYLSTPIPGVEVLLVAGKCGTGYGTLYASGTSALQWTAPGDTVGTAVTIANGQTKTLQSASAGLFCIVRRTSTIDLSGTCTVRTATLYHNALAMDPALAGGAAEYRCIVAKNVGSETATGLLAWVDASSTGIAIGLLAPDGYNAHSDMSVAGDTTAPPGVSFSTPTVEGSALSCDLAIGGHVGLWIRRTPPAVWAAAEIAQKIHLKTPGGEYIELRGAYRCGDSALAQYELYRGVDASPSFVSPWETFAALPHTTAALAVSHTYHFVLRRRNAWNFVSQNITEWEVEIDADGDEVLAPPSAPTNIELQANPGGTVDVRATYNAAADGTTLAADTWLVYEAEGADPVPGVDTPTEITMGGIHLAHTTSAYDTGADVRVLVRVRRSDDTVDSINTTISTTTALASLVAPTPGRNAVTYYTGDNFVAVWTYNASNYMEWDSQREVLRFVVGGNVVAGMGRACSLYLAGEFTETAYTSNSAASDNLSIVGGCLLFAIEDGGSHYRVASLDASGNLLVAAVREKASYPADENTAFANTPPYLWDTGLEALSFTLDGTNTAFSFVKTESGGIFNARLQTRRIRENAF